MMNLVYGKKVWARLQWESKMWDIPWVEALEFERTGVWPS